MNGIILSICLSGRNDNYGYEFKRRFIQSMDFLAWSADRAGVLNKIEVLFTDWNSDVPLSGDITLTAKASAMVRFIEVSPEIAKKMNHEKTPFHTCKSLNVAFRRARGEYISMMPADILWTQYSLRALIALLNGEWTLPFDPEKSVMIVPRRMLDAESNETLFFSSFEQMEKILSLGHCFIPMSELFPGRNGNSGMYILPKKLMQETLRGCDERLGGWGFSDEDISFRAADAARLQILGGFGVYCIDYQPKVHVVKEKLARCSSYHHAECGAADNPSDWGLASYSFKETHAPVAENPFIRKEQPVSPEQSIRDRLIAKMRYVFLKDREFISALGMAAADFVCRHTPRRICLLGLGDYSVCAALSFSDPLTEICIVDPAENNVDRIFDTLRMMEKRVMGEYTPRIGHVHYMVSIPQTTATTGKFDLVICSEKWISDEKLPDFLNENASVISSYPVEKLPGKNYCVHNVYYYTDKPFCPEVAETDWRAADGNILTPLWRLVRRPYRYAAMFARIPLREWGTAWKIIRGSGES